MSLRDKLVEILPTLLPAREEDAIKGTELIARVRAVLGDAYSDRSLRSQFSFIALEEDSCLARVPNGQGYYLRREDVQPSLHNMFESEADATREGMDPLHKALALAVRLYDTAGLGVFVYPVEEEESWGHPDLVAVQWPAGNLTPDGAYVLEPGEEQSAHMRACCVTVAGDAESCRRAFFRALACGLWAQQAELLIIGEQPESPQELAQLAAKYGVGVRAIEADVYTPYNLPRADEIFRAAAEEARALLESLPLCTLAHPRQRSEQQQLQPDMPATLAARNWAQSCITKGRIESYEMRVAVN